MADNINIGFLRKLRIIGVIEGISTLVLFGVAMPLKYVWDTPIAVTIAGGIHGFLFMLLVVMYSLAIRRVPLSMNLAAWGIVGAVFPFGPFVVDRHLKKLVPPTGVEPVSPA